MKPLLYAALAGYVIAAIHAVLAFVNKRRAAERTTLYEIRRRYELPRTAAA